MTGAGVTDRVRGATASRFARQLALVAVAGFGFRLWAVDRWYRQLPLGFSDNFYYSEQAGLLADGRGYIDPFVLEYSGGVEPSAAHPPLYSTYLAVWSLLGLGTPTWHRIASCVLGAGTIVVVGLIGRRLAGRRAGVLAALAAAVFPPLWIADGTLVAESPYALIIGIVVLAGLRLARHRDLPSAALLGATIGLAALTRSEGLALVGLAGLPLVVVIAGVSVRRRILVFATVAAVALAVIAPWSIRNFATFEEPVPLAYGAGEVLKIGNCDRTYDGEFLGYWHISCAYQGSWEPDRSVAELRARRQAIDYIEDNLDRVPVVVAARVGRLWHLYRPAQGIDFDDFFERRGRVPSTAQLWLFYAGAPFALAGAWALRRHRPAVVLLGSLVASATISAAFAFGITRYRIAGDVAFVILAGVGIDHVLRRRTRARSGDGPSTEAVSASA